MTFNWNTDTVYAYTGDTLNYYVTSGGYTVFSGSAKRSPKESAIKINLRKIAEDWLEMEFRDFLPMNGQLYHHEDAFRTFQLFDNDNNLLHTFSCVISEIDGDESGLKNEPINGHADPRQKIFVSHFGDWTGSTTQDVTINGSDIYYFNAQNYVTANWNDQIVFVPISTNYPLGEISITAPSGISVLSRTYEGFWFSVPVNDTSGPISYTVNWYRNGQQVDTTTVTVNEMEVFFQCESYKNINARGGVFTISYDTNLRPDQITVEVPSGWAVVSKSYTGVTITAPANTSDEPFTGVVTFRFDGDIIGGTNLYQAAAGEFSCDAFKLVEYTGGTITIGVDTALDMSRVTVNMPSNWTLVSKTQTGVTISIPSKIAQGDTDNYVEFLYNGTRFLGSTQVTQRGVWLDAADTVVSASGTTTVTIPFTTNIEDWQNIYVNGRGLTVNSMSSTGVTVTVTGPTTAYFNYRGIMLDFSLLFETSSNALTAKFENDTYFTLSTGGVWDSGYNQFYYRKKGDNTWIHSNTGTTIQVQAGDEYEFCGYDGRVYIELPDPDDRVSFYGNFLSMYERSGWTAYDASTYVGGKAVNFNLVKDNLLYLDGLVLPYTTQTYNNAFQGADNLKGAKILFPNTTSGPVYANSMFADCPNLEYGPYTLPWKYDARYEGMFAGCTSLRESPSIMLEGYTSYGEKVSGITDGVFSGMFSGCSSITEVGYVAAFEKNIPLVPGTGYTGAYSFMYAGTSITELPSFNATVLAEACFKGMFKGTKITSIPNGYLPVNDTIPASAYAYMFEDCTLLTSVPVDLLPAANPGTNAYGYMFAGCSSLQTAPNIEATNSSPSCMTHMFYNCAVLTKAPDALWDWTSDCPQQYESMFEGCINLETSPAIYLRTLQIANGKEMRRMFYGCSKLNYVKCFTEVCYNSGMEDWLTGTASAGTIVLNSYQTGVNPPSGWTVIDQTYFTADQTVLYLDSNQSATTFVVHTDTNYPPDHLWVHVDGGDDIGTITWATMTFVVSQPCTIKVNENWGGATPLLWTFEVRNQ